MKRFGLIILLLCIIPLGAQAEEVIKSGGVQTKEGIKSGETLSLETCIEIALEGHPDVVAALNTVYANQSRIGQAKSNYYPQIGLSSGYSRYAPVSNTSNEAADRYTGGAGLTQNIFDFGKTATQVNIQKLNTDSSRSDLNNMKELIILNVKQTYYGVLLTTRNREVATEVVKQFEHHLEQAKGFYEVGTKARFDVTKAEVDLSNAKLSLIKAENALRIAKVNLNNAIGFPDAPEFNIKDNLSFQAYDITIRAAMEKASKDRPDLKSIALKTQAAEESIRLAEKGYYPTLSGVADYNWAGRSFPLDDSWNAGALLTFPLFSGYLTKYQVDEAKANLNILKANEEALMQNIVLEVQQAYLNLQQAKESISTAEIIVKQAEENLELANGRYAAGVGNPIEVTDAVVAYSNAKASYIQALYDHKVAQASLEKAMGER